MILFKWCFWVTQPIALSGILIVMFILPLKRVEGDMKKKLAAVDYVGTALTLGGCTLVILPLIWVCMSSSFSTVYIPRLLFSETDRRFWCYTLQGGVTYPWKSAIVLATLISGFIVVSLFCLWEWKVAKLPIVPSAFLP